MIMLFPLKHLKVKISYILGQGRSSDSAVSDIAAELLTPEVLTFGRKLLCFDLNFDFYFVSFNWLPVFWCIFELLSLIILKKKFHDIQKSTITVNMDTQTENTRFVIFQPLSKKQQLI